MDIYEYDNFRFFLKDKYSQKITENPSYSYRKFAQDAGITNPGFLNDVIKGRRKLSDDARKKMIKAFELNPSEADFFNLLVDYEQSKDLEKKQDLYKQIVFRRNRSNFSRLNPALSRYYQDFHYPLIRAAIMALDFKGDYEALGRFIIPPTPAAQIKKYVRDLCEWGLVQQGSDGKYFVTDQFIEPPSTLKDLVKQINREWIIQSLEALQKTPVDKRHISTIVAAVSSNTEKLLKEKIEKFREEIWATIKSDTEKADRVIQLNIQYFPKSNEMRKS